MAEPTLVLEATGLGYSTPQGRLLAEGISFRLSAGQMLLVTGPNGSGKSTFLKILLGQHSPGQGSFRWVVPRDRIAVIPQLQNIEFHIPASLEDVLRISSGGRFRREESLAIGLLNERQLGAAWNTASGGERQRTLLTRALLQQPQILILDEPFNHLDSQSRELMFDQLKGFLSEAKGRAVVMVAHERLEETTRSGVPFVSLVLKEGRTE